MGHLFPVFILISGFNCLLLKTYPLVIVSARTRAWQSLSEYVCLKKKYLYFVLTLKFWVQNFRLTVLFPHNFANIFQFIF